MTKLDGRQIAAERLDGWVYVPAGLQTSIETKDFSTGLALVNAIGEVAEQQNHHPDLTLRYPAVDIRLSSHDEGGVTIRDVRLARAISSVASGLGLHPSADQVSRLEWALDSPAHASVSPFWAAVFGVRDDDGELTDPADRLPVVWFQRSGEEPDRQRWHPDLWLDPSQVQPRIDAAVAAGGTLVSDADAPAFWVLADPEGNRMCLCTWLDRNSAD
ncbi:4a-hydroxytetrahydrobiopterin dehydratase [Paractinoplanes lichenicola]|uniref:Putative pterin-4-alpha-carbinolamine dehydratase n=1 Tax=Paractinoplanes lichenicola TaxID=2802976 RepID=A0ABS1VKY0_9ACTN|nr:4a-hydroxytetrahydrobiopterin dehydratase [Actinoplanes lichenicola]MBL7254804.1 4a-hydroxytetrahydrobiopterin dehydratase [Actinoplanes lichenicola]